MAQEKKAANPVKQNLALEAAFAAPGPKQLPKLNLFYAHDLSGALKAIVQRFFDFSSLRHLPSKSRRRDNAGNEELSNFADLISYRSVS
ncbi:MAG: hypothetical protein LUO89_13690 [Methanothrix sp.]|nr:hypothetical protein [Methanothrix sp.]